RSALVRIDAGVGSRVPRGAVFTQCVLQDRRNSPVVKVHSLTSLPKLVKRLFCFWNQHVELLRALTQPLDDVRRSLAGEAPVVELILGVGALGLELFQFFGQALTFRGSINLALVDDRDFKIRGTARDRRLGERLCNELDGFRVRQLFDGSAVRFEYLPSRGGR